MDKLVTLAESYIGQKEVKGNQGFVNPDFDAQMRSVGFVNGYAWCALFCKLIWRKMDIKGHTMIVPGVVNTMRNFVKAYKYDLKPKPMVGSLAIYRTYKNGKAQATGHMALVVGVKDHEFYTIEGNGDSNGDREGDSVVRCVRQFNHYNSNGLCLLGFINPDIA